MKQTLYTLVTGASGGIGKALAIEAAKNDHNVILVARNKKALESLAHELEQTYRVKTLVAVSDLSKPGSVSKLVETLEKESVVVDILINNAGYGDYGMFAESNLENQLGMIDLNVRALTELTHALLPRMIERKSGYIVNLGSVASFLPGPLMSVYFASKAYVLSFSEALARELKGTGVSVTCLCPGSTKTQFGESAHVSETHSTRTSHVTADQVAEFGWQAMLQEKPVAIYGGSNRFAVTIMKFVPRKLVARIVERIQR